MQVMLAGYHIINFTVILRHSTQTHVTKERTVKKQKKNMQKCEENEKVAVIKIMRKKP